MTRAKPGNTLIGRGLVIGFLAMAVVGIGATVIFRTTMRPRFAAELDESSGVRLAAFLGLLRANNNLGRAREYVTDARPEAFGAEYLQAVPTGSGASTNPATSSSAFLHVVRAAKDRAGPPLLSDVFVFTEDGILIAIEESAAAFLLDRSAEADSRRGAVVVIAATDDPSTCRIVLLGSGSGEQITSIPLLLLTVDGEVLVRPGDASAAVDAAPTTRPSALDISPVTGDSTAPGGLPIWRYEKGPKALTRTPSPPDGER